MKRTVRHALFVVGIALAVWAVAKSAADVLEYAGIDFRARVVASTSSR